MSDARPSEREDGGSATPLSLLERARGRDEQAWQRLVALYRPLVLFWCGRGGVAPGDTEDVAGEVFACVVRDLGGFHRDRPGDTFRGWLRVLTRNQVLLYFRKNQDRAVAEGGSDAWQRLQNVTGPEEDEGEQMGQVYRRALEQVRREFEDPTWRAFWLTAIEQRSPAALAAELGMSVAAIRQAKSRVLRRIKTELGDLLE
jgi:RNA polymerase sigma-70 factor (ECF subfamily)